MERKGERGMEEEEKKVRLLPLLLSFLSSSSTMPVGYSTSSLS